MSFLLLYVISVFYNTLFLKYVVIVDCKFLFKSGLLKSRLDAFVSINRVVCLSLNPHCPGPWSPVFFYLWRDMITYVIERPWDLLWRSACRVLNLPLRSCLSLNSCLAFSVSIWTLRTVYGACHTCNTYLWNEQISSAEKWRS